MLANLLSQVHQILAAPADFTQLDAGIHRASIQVERHNVYFIYQTKKENLLVVYEATPRAQEFDDVESSVDGAQTLLTARLTEHNFAVLAERFPWLKPVSRVGYKYSFGLGDRLGNASCAHLKLFKGRGVLPVLAQQSIRELMLTGRSFSEVLHDAGWSVFAEGYKDGWGADGDHVKTPFEVDYAVKAGFTMITLDCSDRIHNEIVDLTDAARTEKFNALPDELRTYFEKTYLHQTFTLRPELTLSLSEKDLQESVLIYYDAILYMEEIYQKFVVPNALDFEISVDETIVPTTPANHFFVANELRRLGVHCETLAPKFYGEFQKGIDYIGDLDRFEKEYVVHEALAEYFGYRLSIHSGSDKLSVYPIIGKISAAHGWHVKTAGTNWLEALKVIAVKDPQLLLRMYRFSYDNLADVKPFYHFKATQETAIHPDDVKLINVFDLLVDEDPRQILHTMYGSILNAQENFKPVFADEFWHVLRDNQALYDSLLNKHIAKHLDLLQGRAKDKAEVLAKYDYRPAK